MNRRSFLERAFACMGILSLGKSSPASKPKGNSERVERIFREEQWRVSRDFSENEVEDLVSVAVNSNNPKSAINEYLKSIGVEDLSYDDIKSEKTPRHSAALKKMKENAC